MSERIWIAMYASALLLSLMQAIFIGWSGFVQGLSIVIGTTLILLILGVSDYQKDRQFLAIQDLLTEQTVTVIRGKREETQTISVWKLVVGDVILLTTGDRVPVDCLVLNSEDLQLEHPSHL